jgi:hypothetical protein
MTLVQCRQRFREGNLTKELVFGVLQRILPSLDYDTHIETETCNVLASDIFWLQMSYGFSVLSVSAWTELLKSHRPPQCFRSDLPQESRTRINQRTIRECEHCWDSPEKAYLGNLWKSALRAFDLPDPFRLPDPNDVENAGMSGRTSRVRSSEFSPIRIRQNAWRLFEVAQFLELAPIDLWELSDPDIQTLLGWLDALPADIQRSVWRRVFDSIPLSRS